MERHLAAVAENTEAGGLNFAILLRLTLLVTFRISQTLDGFLD